MFSASMYSYFIFLCRSISTFTTMTNCIQKNQVTICTDEKCTLHVHFLLCFQIPYSCVELISTFSTVSNCNQINQVTICTEKNPSLHVLCFYAFIFHIPVMKQFPHYLQDFSKVSSESSSATSSSCSVSTGKSIRDIVIFLCSLNIRQVIT